MIGYTNNIEGSRGRRLESSWMQLRVISELLMDARIL